MRWCFLLQLFLCTTISYRFDIYEGEATYKSSSKYGAESNDACKATLTDGLARTRPVSPVAAIIAYSRHEATSDLVDTISHAETVTCIKQWM